MKKAAAKNTNWWNILANCIAAAALMSTVALVTEVTWGMVDLNTDRPESASLDHISANKAGIREIVRRADGSGIALGSPARTDCWEENDPALEPSESYRVQRCRIHFGGLGHHDLSADYIVLMENPLKQGPSLLWQPNHTVVDAYLEADSLETYPERNELGIREFRQE